MSYKSVMHSAPNQMMAKGQQSGLSMIMICKKSNYFIIRTEIYNIIDLFHLRSIFSFQFWFCLLWVIVIVLLKDISDCVEVYEFDLTIVIEVFNIFKI